MSGYTLSEKAETRLEEIVDYTRRHWGEEQAVRYLDGLVAHLEAIAGRRVQWREISDHLGVNGWFARYERHLIYWTVAQDGTISVATILHERMHHGDLLKDAFAP